MIYVSTRFAVLTNGISVETVNLDLPLAQEPLTSTAYSSSAKESAVL